jgi:hypothetical protein
MRKYLLNSTNEAHKTVILATNILATKNVHNIVAPKALNRPGFPGGSRP